MTTQIHAVGPVPDVGELFVAALMYSTAAEVNSVLKPVHDDDVDTPLSELLGIVRSLAAQGVPPSPQLVADELKRRGALNRRLGTALAAVATTGACSTAARHYAAAVVHQALRRKVESYGAALVSAADNGTEESLRSIVEQATAAILETADRLAQLRDVTAVTDSRGAVGR